MRSSVIWSFLSVAVASGALMVGCDGDAKIVKSGEDESCVKTSDCSEGLKCQAQLCVKSGSDSNGAGGDKATGGEGPTGPDLGGEGESCQSRTDCDAGLGCFNQRCTTQSGEGGASNGPTLGGEGETCGLTADCNEGLACMPVDDGNGYGGRYELKALGSSVGVCSQVNSGLVPTGLGCGAECLTADDCCELPTEVHALNGIYTPYGTGVNSCAELAAVLVGVNCKAAILTVENAARCAAEAMYCECAQDTWSCNAGRCSYDAACTVSGATPGGCPPYSRSGIPQFGIVPPYQGVALCDIGGSDTCGPPKAAPCKTNAGCEGELMADLGLPCGEDECVCYAPTGGCLRGCDEDLDCPVSNVCDTKTKVCVPGDGCTTDTQCAILYDDFRATCQEGVCGVVCANDLDCNGGRLTNGQYTRVCNAEQRCEMVGCTASSDCGPSNGGLQLFCAELPVSEPGDGARSAISG